MVRSPALLAFDLPDSPQAFRSFCTGLLPKLDFDPRTLHHMPVLVRVCESAGARHVINAVRLRDRAVNHLQKDKLCRTRVSQFELSARSWNSLANSKHDTEKSARNVRLMEDKRAYALADEGGALRSAFAFPRKLAVDR